MDLTCPSPSLPFIVHSNLTLNSMNQGVQGKCITSKAAPTRTTPFSMKSCPGWDSNPRDTLLTRQSALPTELPGQLRRQGSKSTTQHNTCTVCSHHYHIHTSTKLTSTPFTPSHHPFTPSHHPFTHSHHSFTPHHSHMHYIPIITTSTPSHRPFTPHHSHLHYIPIITTSTHSHHPFTPSHHPFTPHHSHLHYIPIITTSTPSHRPFTPHHSHLHYIPIITTSTPSHRPFTPHHSHLPTFPSSPPAGDKHIMNAKKATCTVFANTNTQQ